MGKGYTQLPGTKRPNVFARGLKRLKGKGKGAAEAVRSARVRAEAGASGRGYGQMFDGYSSAEDDSFELDFELEDIEDCFDDSDTEALLSNGGEGSSNGRGSTRKQQLKEATVGKLKEMSMDRAVGILAAAGASFLEHAIPGGSIPGAVKKVGGRAITIQQLRSETNRAANRCTCNQCKANVDYIVDKLNRANKFTATGAAPAFGSFVGLGQKAKGAWKWAPGTRRQGRESCARSLLESARGGCPRASAIIHYLVADATAPNSDELVAAMGS